MTEHVEPSPGNPSPAAGAAVLSPRDLRGPAGRLEALFTPGAPGAGCAAVFCHPHPLFGGTMHNKVVYHAAKVLQQLGLPVLRFNFRGAGASEGTHDRGEGEQQDLVAAMEWLTRLTGLPLMVGGFSFGGYVALRACSTPSETALGRVRALVALGLPIQAGDRGYSYQFLTGSALPKLFISGSADEFGPVAEVERVVAGLAPPKQLVWVQGADHFFRRPRTPDEPQSGLAAMQDAFRGWLIPMLPGAPLQVAADRPAWEAR